jgi:hypothetical protein
VTASFPARSASASFHDPTLRYSISAGRAELSEDVAPSDQDVPTFMDGEGLQDTLSVLRKLGLDEKNRKTRHANNNVPVFPCTN